MLKEETETGPGIGFTGAELRYLQTIKIPPCLKGLTRHRIYLHLYAELGKNPERRDELFSLAGRLALLPHKQYWDLLSYLKGLD